MICLLLCVRIILFAVGARWKPYKKKKNCFRAFLSGLKCVWAFDLSLLEWKKAFWPFKINEYIPPTEKHHKKKKSRYVLSVSLKNLHSGLLFMEWNKPQQKRRKVFYKWIDTEEKGKTVIFSSFCEVFFQDSGALLQMIMEILLQKNNVNVLKHLHFL